MCVAMNDLEYVRRTISLIPDEVQIETVLEAVEAAAGETADREQWRRAITALMDQAVNQLEADIMMVITRIGVKVPFVLPRGFSSAWKLGGRHKNCGKSFSFKILPIISKALTTLSALMP